MEIVEREDGAALSVRSETPRQFGRDRRFPAPLRAANSEHERAPRTLPPGDRRLDQVRQFGSGGLRWHGGEHIGGIRVRNICLRAPPHRVHMPVSE